MKKTVGFLGGTFDPIHLGHINLALEILEKSEVDEILFCPVNISPHKIDSPPIASSKERLEMVQLGVQRIDRFSVTDCEILSKEISYTIETLKKLLEDSEDQYRLILAKDAAISFPTWNSYQEIMQIAPLIIGMHQEEKKSLPSSLLEEQVIEVDQMEISSTKIRKRLFERRYCAHLLLPKVLDYIYEHHLYLNNQ